MTIWLPVMFRDELDMLECRLAEYAGQDVVHVVTESPVTHRGEPKPLHFQENRDRFRPWADRIVYGIATLNDTPDPWVREHHQRDAAWAVIGREAADGDVVVIGDCDEFPSAVALAWDGEDGVVSLWMRTMLFAVDWEVPAAYLPPTAVMVTAGWLRRQQSVGMAAVRDSRAGWPLIRDGGMHLSWIGGPERQRTKLLTATCHTENLGTTEADLILSGERWRTGRHGPGNLPVRPVDVDEAWPKYVQQRRCPAEWFRPREDSACAR